MAKIRLKFDPDRVTIGDLVKIEEGDASASEMREFLIKFLVDERDKPIKGKRAIAIINKMTISEVLNEVGKLGEMVKDEAVPPPQGGS